MATGRGWIICSLCLEDESQEEGRTTGTALVLEKNIKAFHQCPAPPSHTGGGFPSVKQQENPSLCKESSKSLGSGITGTLFLALPSNPLSL